ncbi:serine/threonine protein kinase [Pandoraea sputorum]|nr:serine/threonine protein kinase [Pandoraea sputorum]
MNTDLPQGADAPQHPFAALLPDTVITAVEQLGSFSDGRLLALNSYENRVYQVGMEDGPPLIAKFYRPERWTDDAILEEHAFTLTLAQQEIPVVAPLEIHGATLHHFDGFRFALFPRRGGRAPELQDPDTLNWLGRFLGRIHAQGATQPYQHRLTLDIDTYGRAPVDYLWTNDFIPPDLRDAWRTIVDLALDSIARAYERAGDVKLLRVHGDCHGGNVLWTDAGPHFVDFDDTCMAPAMQDLWMLLSGTRAEMTGQLDEVLSGYEDFADFNPRELHLTEALRTLRLLHYSAWLARRWNDPAFPAAFPWFNTQRYWQDRILELREQVALMDEPPLTWR